MNEIGSLYWVITHNCNSRCAHCYMSCGPGMPSLTKDEADAVIENLPRRINCNIILSGGEVLQPDNRELLFHVAGQLLKKYGRRPLAIQTNGDFLDPAAVRECLNAGITHFSIASMDVHHPERFASLKAKESYFRNLLKNMGFAELPTVKRLSPETAELNGRISEFLRVVAPELEMRPNFAIWGANEEIWLGGNWARGRALENGLVFDEPNHNFCNIWSGGLNFLRSGSPRQEVAVQLSWLYPCCPTTRVAIADLREEPLITGLKRASRHPIFNAINNGKPWLGASEFGISTTNARNRFRELNNSCRLCDELLKHLDDDRFPPSPFDVYTRTTLQPAFVRRVSRTLRSLPLQGPLWE